MPPLSWKDGDDLGNVQSLINTSVESLAHYVPEIKSAKYDFETGTFRDSNGRRIFFDGSSATGQQVIQRATSTTGDSNTVRSGDVQPTPDGLVASWDGRARGGKTGTGRATIKRGILLNTLAHQSSGEKFGLLEQVLRKPDQLLTSALTGILYRPALKPGVLNRVSTAMRDLVSRRDSLPMATYVNQENRLIK